MRTTLRPTSNARRCVGRFVAHGEPVSFRQLCRAVLGKQTRYLVLDLDGTIHLGRNLGELFGWEISAYKSYGSQTIARFEPRPRGGRWVWDWSEPHRIVSYLTRAARAWAVPGTHYFFWSKLGSHSRLIRRAGFRKFRADPICAVQRGVQTTLMDEVESTPKGVLPTLMERVWRRHLGDQVIGADDIRWIREAFPQVEIILSSASPKPVVSFAAERLGIEHAFWSTPARINSGKAKIETLMESFGDFCDPEVEVVGMSDTARGEDHCWAQYFTKVVDLNSPDPFPPIVPIDSPLAEVHSAVVLSRDELEHRAFDPSYLDPRRDPVKSPRHRELTSTDVFTYVGDLLQRINTLASGTEGGDYPAELAYRMAVLSESSRARLA